MLLPVVVDSCTYVLVPQNVLYVLFISIGVLHFDLCERRARSRDRGVVLYPFRNQHGLHELACSLRSDNSDIYKPLGQGSGLRHHAP